MLATTGAQRMPDLPDTPTLAEQGFPSLKTSDWFGMFAPAGTPAAQVARLQNAMREALNDAVVRESFQKLGVQPAFIGASDFAPRIKDESVAFAALVKSVGFVPEE